MSKEKTVFICNQCAYEASKWMGRCMSCGQYNTFEEVVFSSRRKGSTSRKAASGAALDKLSDISEDGHRTG